MFRENMGLPFAMRAVLNGNFLNILNAGNKQNSLQIPKSHAASFSALIDNYLFHMKKAENSPELAGETIMVVPDSEIESKSKPVYLLQPQIPSESLYADGQTNWPGNEENPVTDKTRKKFLVIPVNAGSAGQNEWLSKFTRFNGNQQTNIYNNHSNKFSDADVKSLLRSPSLPENGFPPIVQNRNGKNPGSVLNSLLLNNELPGAIIQELSQMNALPETPFRLVINFSGSANKETLTEQFPEESRKGTDGLPEIVVEFNLADNINSSRIM